MLLKDEKFRLKSDGDKARSARICGNLTVPRNDRFHNIFWNLKIKLKDQSGTNGAFIFYILSHMKPKTYKRIKTVVKALAQVMLND